MPRRHVDEPKLCCPTCGKRFSSDQSPAKPFCSPRCQQVDLGRWLDEEIGLPVENNDPDVDVDETYSN